VGTNRPYSCALNPYYAISLSNAFGKICEKEYVVSGSYFFDFQVGAPLELVNLVVGISSSSSASSLCLATRLLSFSSSDGIGMNFSADLGVQVPAESVVLVGGGRVGVGQEIERPDTVSGVAEEGPPVAPPVAPPASSDAGGGATVEGDVNDGVTGV
jgi:hypothetical protein